MKRKALFATVIAAPLALVLGACSATPVGGDNGGSEAKALTLKIGYVDTPGTLVDLAAIRFEEELEERSGGAITVENFGGGQLGAENEMVESMGLGALDMAIVGDSVISVFAPEYSALSFPYLVESAEHLEAIGSSEIADELSAVFQEELGVSVDRWLARAPRMLSANRAVETPADLAGLKLRVPANPVMEAAWAALGASPTPVAFNELFLALQQGVVDAQENPIDTVVATHFEEVQSHQMLTEHLFAPYFVLVSDRYLEGLDDQQREWISESMDAAQAHLRELVAQGQSEGLETLKAAGMTIITPDIDAFRSKLMDSGVIDDFADEWAEGLVERIRALA
jgi:tripartite ATP-independent periplasmic transporter solute receptor, DctP family